MKIGELENHLTAPTRVNIYFFYIIEPSHVRNMLYTAEICCGFVLSQVILSLS